MAAMTIYSQAVTPDSSPTPSQAASTPPISRPPSPMPLDIPPPEPIIHETIANQFGLYRRFRTWPSVDPENDITIDDLIDAPTFINTTDHGYRKAEEAFGPMGASPNPFAPYLNATVYRLMSWFYQTGSKTLNDLNSLVHNVILAPDFDADHLQHFSASSEAKRLDDNLMCPASDGWHESSVKIRLPKTRAKYACKDDAPEAEVSGVLHRDLLQLIISAFKDPSFEAFHLKGFTQLWKPSPDEPVEEIYGEAYASEMFREMEHEVQSMKPLSETLESIVVPIMAYSDSTHLANFGTAALWLIYFFIDLTSKYIRSKPTSFSAHHLAYIPSVSNIFLLLKLVLTISQLPDSIQDVYKEIYGTAANSDILTFLKRELVHAIWSLLINDDFINAYTFGIIVLCADGIERRLFPRFFTYSADYPEKYISLLYVIYLNLYTRNRIVLSTIKFLGDCLCPLCTCGKEKVRDLGTKADESRRSMTRVDSEERQNMVEKARGWIFEQGRAVTSEAIDNYLGFSMTPIRVRLSQKKKIVF